MDVRVDRITADAPRRLELLGHVDRPAVTSVRAAIRSDPTPTVLDLGRARSWDRDAVTALTALLDQAPDGLAVVAPRASSFLGVLDGADLPEVWTVYDEVRRLRLAVDRLARSRDRVRVRR